MYIQYTIIFDPYPFSTSADVTVDPPVACPSCPSSWAHVDFSGITLLPIELVLKHDKHKTNQYLHVDRPSIDISKII